MKRCCSKIEVLKHCEIDSGFWMNRIHPVELVLKFEKNPLLRQFLSEMGFLT